MLQVTNISVCYDSVKAVQDISFYLGENECVALVGSNGAGKTSALKAICGLVSLAQGKILLKGENLSPIHPCNRVEHGIVYVPEGRRVFAKMSVLENLEISAYNRHARTLKDETLEMVYGLFPRLRQREKQMAGTLSGGEQQMLAIGRGLMSRPSVLMLDEPSLGLAPVIVDEVYEKLQEIRHTGVSILLVEEDIFRAFSVATRGYVLENGQIVLDGNAGDLLKNEYVKQAYMGS